MSKESYIQLAMASAQQYNLDPQMFVAQLEQESAWNPSAKSKAGAIGIAQFMPKTAREFGIDPRKPEQAIPAAAKYMAQLRDQLGSEDLARLAYNWGIGNVQKWQKSGGEKAMPKEAAEYNNRIYRKAGLQPLLEGVEPSKAGAGRGVVNPPIAKPAGKPGIQNLLAAAMAEINDGQPPGAYLNQMPGAQMPEMQEPTMAAAAPTPKQEPDWRRAMANLSPSAQAGQLPGGWDGVDIDQLQASAEREQDTLMARMFNPAQAEETPKMDLPSGVDRYLNQILA